MPKGRERLPGRNQDAQSEWPRRDGVRQRAVRAGGQLQEMRRSCVEDAASGPSDRGQVEQSRNRQAERNCLLNRSTLEIAIELIGRIRPRVSLIGQKALQNSHRTRLLAIEPIFEPSGERRSMSKGSRCRQKTSYFQIRADAVFDTPEEFQNIFIAERDRRIALFHRQQRAAPDGRSRRISHRMH